MVDERDRARARLGLPPLTSTSAAPSAPIVDEQTKAQAMRTSTPTRAASPASVRKFEETGKSLETPTPVVTPVTPTPTWTKASTIVTANGPVDVDANGLAADGSRPVAIVAGTNISGVPAGFTAGPFPKELEQFFGSSEGVIGYRIETLTDKNGRTYNQLSVATSPNSSKTFGAGFTQGTDGKYSLFSPAGGVSGSSTGTSTTGTTLKTAEQIALDAKNAQDKEKRQSAYDLLYNEFERYGLASLVTPLKDLITSGVSPSEFTLRLRETDAYKKRFVANEARIKNGLRALSEGEYIRSEDAYQEVMRRRGLPESYYARGDMGIQKGFESLIAGDVSSTELEDRIVTAQDRVLNANPEIARTLKEFYPGISNGDILAYVLDPANAINVIKRKVMTAEIGAAAKAEGLTSGLSRAEELAMSGITGEAARQGYRTIAGVVPRAEQLSQIYNQDPYTQQTAEAEVFGLTGSTEAARQRKKLTQLETAAFSGSAGAGAIARDRAGVL
jgi:hypothetical protein